MKVCYWYYFVEPLKEHYFDDGSTDLLEIEIEGSENDYKVALVGTDQTPEILRISFYNEQDEPINDIKLNAIQMFKEHMLSILRVNSFPDLVFNKIHAWTFVEEGVLPRLNFRMKFGEHRGVFPSDNIENSFKSTWANRHLVKLLTEGNDENIPLYYRYLSFYRILEIIYKDNGKWNKYVEELLKEFEDRFNQLNLTKMKLLAYIELLRNRCAHGKFIYKKVNEKGITGLDNKGLIDLNKFVPIMKEIVVTAVNNHEDTLGKFALGSPEEENAS